MIVNPVEFTHPAYIDWLRMCTYTHVAVLALQRGKLDGCWETLIGERLKADCTQQKAVALKTMEDLGFEKLTPDVWEQAGSLIINNNKIELDVD